MNGGHVINNNDAEINDSHTPSLGIKSRADGNSSRSVGRSLSNYIIWAELNDQSFEAQDWTLVKCID